MTKSLIMWACILVAAFIVGPAAGWLSGSVRGPDGGPAATGLVSEAPITGLLKMGAVVLLAGGMGVAGARVSSAKVGLFCAGLVLAWGAWRGGRMDEILRRAQSPAPLWSLVVESALLGGLAVIVGIIILRAGRADQHDKADRALSPTGLAALGIAIVVGAVAAMLVGKSEMVGQAFAGAFSAGLLGATVGRVVKHNAPMAVFIGAGAVLAVAAPAAGAITGSGRIVQELYSGDLLALARLAPLDWLAGIFIGVPLGAAWAASMIEVHHHGKPAS